MRIICRYIDTEPYDYNNETYRLKAEMKAITGSDALFDKILEEAKNRTHRIEWIFSDAMKLLKKDESPDEIMQKLRRSQA
jgi:hypothetical protein